jgi:hypothetical protein
MTIHDHHLDGEPPPRNPFDYLVALLRHEAEVAADPRAWLPWTYRTTLKRIQTSTPPVPAAA